MIRFRPTAARTKAYVAALAALAVTGGVLTADPAVDQDSRDKLSDVLRELLECKRILERAREN